MSGGPPINGDLASGCAPDVAIAKLFLATLLLHAWVRASCFWVSCGQNPAVSGFTAVGGYYRLLGAPVSLKKNFSLQSE